jgi:hypothetical protein
LGKYNKNNSLVLLTLNRLSDTIDISFNKGTKMTKTYTVAGLATDKKGNTKVRYANNLDTRLKVLKRDGFTNLNFIHTDTPKTKIELCNMMLGLIQFQNDKDLITREQVSIVLQMDKEVTKRERQQRKKVLVVGTFSC